MVNSDVIKNLKKLSDWDMAKMIEFSENAAKELNVNTTQLRKFHGHISKIWHKYLMNKPVYLRDNAKFGKEIKDEIVFVKAYLAYQAGRQREVAKLQEILGMAIDRIQDQKDFEIFKKFYDSIVAYRRFSESQSQRGGSR